MHFHFLYIKVECRSTDKLEWRKRVPYSQVDLVEPTHLSTISIVELSATS